MKTFKSLAALEAAAKRAAQVTLRNQVATLVEHKIREKAQEVVYGSYSPVMYPRRNTLGTTFALIPSGYNLRIYGYFAQMINDTGAPNVFNNADYPWMHPRKFYDAAVADLNGSSELISVVRAGFLANI